MSSLLIRDATAADLPRVVELLQQMSLDEPRESPGPPLPRSYYDALAAIERDANHRLLVLCEGESVLATASFFVVPNISYGGRPHAIIENVVVDAAERGHGVGAALVRHCIELAREAGCTRLSLSTDARRADAHRFYERLGFVASHRGYRLKLA
ncbi:MAG TPA: GNAT family N-acetyltransferase [Dehalococcoidia bacterium]|nr:GNAT family N-acetyltransferase [Dehalococcoidia bacterium]